jgi:hypothetical protein
VIELHRQGLSTYEISARLAAEGRPLNRTGVGEIFAQDTGTHHLVYANADLSKAIRAREVLAFCEHWKQASGHDPAMLVMDQKVTTQDVLGQLDARGIKFLTLRMRSLALLRHINSLPPGDFKTITLDRAGQFSQPARPKVHEDPAVRLTSYPVTHRQ